MLVYKNNLRLLYDYLKQKMFMKVSLITRINNAISRRNNKTLYK